MTAWPLVPLGELLTQSEEWIKLDPLATITQIRVQWWGQGPVVRRTATAGELGSSKWLMVRRNQFLISRIDARKGAAGVVPGSLDGAFVSNDFPAFDIVSTRLEPKFLDWYSKTTGFIRDCEAASEGTTNRVRLKEDRFYAITMPLPPIEEQRRIVDRIEALTCRARSLEQLAQTTGEEKEEILPGIVSEITDRLIQSHGSEPLEALTTFMGDMNHEMPFSVENGVPLISPKDFGPDWTIDFNGAKRISSDDFARHAVKCKPQKHDILLARYGTIGAARFVDVDADFLASYSIAVIRPDIRRVLPRFLFWMVTSRHIQEQAIQGIRGSGMADLGLKTIRRFRIPIVGVDEQIVIVRGLDEVRAQISSLRRYSAGALGKIKTLIPSILNHAFSGQL